MLILCRPILYTLFCGIRVLPPVWEQFIKHFAQENMLFTIITRNKKPLQHGTCTSSPCCVGSAGCLQRLAGFAQPSVGCLQINRPPRAACLSPTSAAANGEVKATAVLTGAEHLDPVQLEVGKRGRLSGMFSC